MTDIKGIECRFAFYSKSNDQTDFSDFHLIKEKITYDNGATENKLRQVVNFKRPFWISNKAAQNHNSKKEWEDIVNLKEFKSTQIDLVHSAAKALGKPWFKGSLRDLHESPYIYGTDISSTALIKQKYMDKWDINTPFTNAVFDTETDVIHGTNEIMMATISFKDKVFTAVQKSFVSGQIPRRSILL